MMTRRALQGLLAVLVLAVSPAASTGERSSDTMDGFRARMDGAVSRMHEGMNVPYTGDADRDFARMMSPHHQGASDMAIVELRYGKDERLKRLAQEIVVTQQQEIAIMHLVLGDAAGAGAGTSTQTAPRTPHVHQEH